MEEREREERDKQFLKTRGRTVVRDGGRVRVFREVQFWKVEDGRIFREGGRETFIRRVRWKQQKGKV